MCSRFRDRLAVVLCALALAPAAAARELVVCADPDDVPYSSRDASGFENRIAEVVADAIGADVRFVWQPLRRGVVRKTLRAGACDVLAGVPVGIAGVATTAPYYRSSYVFVYPRDVAQVASFDDPRLRRLAVGVELVGDDMAATPPALALARRGIVGNVTGFPVFGDEPAGKRIVDALDAGRLDVALAWGPRIGYFARHAKRPLALAPAPDDVAPMRFAIALGVRKGDLALRDELDGALARSRDRIRAILAEYGVPLADPSPRVAEAPR